MPKPPRRSSPRPTAKVSRRRFMTLLAAGALAASAPARGAVTMRDAPKPSPKPTGPRRSATVEKGIAEQKDFLAKQLKTLRDFPLAAGSDPAFVFRPVAPRRVR